jgi:hypothetical protein
MCPFNLCGLIDAPSSFILGMDTRFFDMFDPPKGVICVDLDTNMISWTPDNISLKILPRKPLNTLKAKLTEIEAKIKRLNEFKVRLVTANASLSQQLGGKTKISARDEAEIKRTERVIDLSIREAFLRFNATILSNYKSFLRTVTRRPDTKAIDRNLSKFFDSEGFLRSKETSCQLFYGELIKTQLFYDCIMNLSFTSELDPVLADSFAFFAEFCSRVNSHQHSRDDDIRMLEYIEHSNNQTVVVLPPSLDDKFLSKFNPNYHNLTSPSELTNELISQCSSFIYNMEEKCFPKTKLELYLTSNRSNANSTPDLLNSSFNSHDATANGASLTGAGNASNADTQSISSGNNQVVSRRANRLETPITVRTKAEKLQAQKRIVSKLNMKLVSNIKVNEKNKYTVAKHHAFHFLSNAYALWFMCFPGYIKDCENLTKNGLNYAYQVLIQMQNHNLTQPEEVFYFQHSNF